jgi:hypothetical protein
MREVAVSTDDGSGMPATLVTDSLDLLIRAGRFPGVDERMRGRFLFLRMGERAVAVGASIWRFSTPALTRIGGVSRRGQPRRWTRARSNCAHPRSPSRSSWGRQSVSAIGSSRSGKFGRCRGDVQRTRRTVIRKA